MCGTFLTYTQLCTVGLGQSTRGRVYTRVLKRPGGIVGPFILLLACTLYVVPSNSQKGQKGPKTQKCPKTLKTRFWRKPVFGQKAPFKVWSKNAKNTHFGGLWVGTGNSSLRCTIGHFRPIAVSTLAWDYAMVQLHVCVRF